MIEKTVSIDKAAELLEVLTEANDAVMLWGAPGIGKSDVVAQLGARKQRKVIDFRAALREAVDLRGVPVPNEETGTTKWFVPDELPNAERDGEEGYLFLDEINAASPQVQAALFGLVLDRRLGEYELPKGWRIIAAGNRVADRAAAQRMPTALRNRFAHIFVEADVDAWVKWANRASVAPEVVAFVRLRRELIHVMPKGEENAFPTPRSITRAAKYTGADKSIRIRLFASHIGDAAAAELDGFIDLYRTIGSLDDVIANPDTAEVPTEPSLRYAVATGLARMATKKNFAAVVTFAKRLPREIEMLCILDATNRDATLKNTVAYGEWAVKNQSLILQN